jgi:hypothetical protein
MNEILINAILFLSFLLDVALSMFILIKSQRKESDYAFIVTALSIGMWTLGILMFRVTKINEYAWMWNREFIVSSGVIASSFLHFTLCINDVRLSNAKKMMLHAPNLFILVGVFMPNMFIRNIVINSWGKESILGYLYPLFGCYFTAYVTYSLYKIYVNIKNKIGILRTQFIYIFVATLLTSIIGTYFNLYLILMGNYRYIWIGPYNSLIFVFIITYAITKHHLMDIFIIISRAFAEGMSIMFHAFIYIALVWLYMSSMSNEVGVRFIVMTLVYGIVIGLTHQKIRLFIQTTSDKVFLRGKYDYYKELSEIGSEILRSTSKENMISTLNKAFYSVLEVSNPRIYLDKELDKLEIAQYLSYIVPTFIGKTLILPCIIENRLVAMIILGPKLSEDPYTDEDIRLLKNIASQTAIALDHIRAYEEMLAAKKQLMLSEKMSFLGEVAVKLASELKKPLDEIINISANIDSGISNRQYLLQFAAVVPNAINKMDEMVEKMLKISKQQDQ